MDERTKKQQQQQQQQTIIILTYYSLLTLSVINIHFTLHNRIQWKL